MITNAFIRLQRSQGFEIAAIGIVLLLIFYSPFHGAFARLFHPASLPHTLQEFKVSVNGLVNLVSFFGMLLVTLAFSAARFSSVIAGLKWHIWLPLVLWGLGAIIHVQELNKDSVFGAMNACLLGSLGVALLVGDRSGQHGQSSFATCVRRFGLPVFTMSVIAALLAPWLLEAQRIWFFDGRVYRYSGISAGPSVTGFIGVALGSWAMFELVSKQWLTRRSLVWVLTALLVSVVAVYLSVLRIAVLGVLTVAIALFWQKRRVLQKLPRNVLGGFILVIIATQFTPPFLTKWMPYQSQGLDLTRPVGEVVEQITHTNGRSAIFRKFWTHVERKPLLGHGTGSAERLEPRLSPHSDYLRVVVEHGFLGLALFVWMGLALLLTVRSAVARSALIGFAVILATDNFLIYPIFGYFPLLFGACCYAGAPLADEDRSDS